MNFERWVSLAGVGPFAAKDKVSVVQFSGGRTSGMLTALSDPNCLLCFQNTGKEHERTLEFIEECSLAFKRKIIWLEFRPPKIKASPPKDFEFAVVDFKTAARKGEPFSEMMRCLAEYRISKGKGPIAPWARSRICTAYLKSRCAEKYLASIGADAYEFLLGLRYDEPERVARLAERETQRRTLRAPLFDAKIEKSHVMDFWSKQSFDLNLEEYEGNCTGCFLKDYADISRAIGDDEEEIRFWQGMQDMYDSFGGQRFPSYQQLAMELPTRKHIESELKSGNIPANVHGLDQKRFRLVLAQEKRRFANGPSKISCQCEASIGVDTE